MMLESLFDDWLAPDDADLLAHWDDFVTQLVGARLGPDTVVTPEAMAAQFGQVREHGWLDLATDDETTPTVYFEAVKRLHRRVQPLPVPMLELWTAARLLRRLPGEAAAGLLGASGPVLLSIDDLFSPGTGAETGWVPFANGATVLVPVVDGDGVAIHAVDGRAAALTPASHPDPTLPAFVLELGGVTADTLVGRLDPADWAAVRGDVLVAQCAALVGQAQAQLVDTTAYLTTREQFGVPIGSFQALRHRAADLAVEVYAAQQLSIHAAEVLDGHRDPLALGYLAKAFAGTAAMRMASEAVQLHGGMGFTWEGGTHFGLKRGAYLSMNGLSIAECEDRLGQWAIAAPALLWAGGLDSDSTAKDGTE